VVADVRRHLEETGDAGVRQPGAAARHRTIKANMEGQKAMLLDAGMEGAFEGGVTGAPTHEQTIASAWARVSTRLRAELGEDVYSSWFGRLVLERVEAGTASFTVPTKFLRSWLEQHFTDRILALLAEERLGVERIQVAVRPCARPMPLGPLAVPQPRHEPPPAPRPSEGGLIGSPLDRRLAFETFLVGRSNALAHAAAQQVGRAKPREAPSFNPLYIHAAVGLGKTHLLQAIAGAAEAGHRRVLYLTAERFMFGFVSALKAQTASAYKENLRGIDVLIIDDLQFLQGKMLQQEFGHTLNALLDGGQQVVIAADRPPSDLEAFEERLRSRLAGGLAIEMGQLEEELRQKILERRIAAAKMIHPGFEVPASVMAYVARTVCSSGRDLDGAVNRLLAHNTLTDRPITLEMAEMALRDLVRTQEPKRVKIEDIQRVVAKHYNVSRADILSSRRTQTVVRPRQIAMFLSKQLTLRSLPEIGRRFGGRDHTTVLHAVRKIDDLATRDFALAEEIELLKRLLQE
jgi:chromosomal replication initiator protein